MGCSEVPIGFTAIDAEFLGEADASGTSPTYAENTQPRLGPIYDVELDAMQFLLALHEVACYIFIGASAPKFVLFFLH